MKSRALGHLGTPQMADLAEIGILVFDSLAQQVDDLKGFAGVAGLQ